MHSDSIVMSFCSALKLSATLQSTAAKVWLPCNDIFNNRESQVKPEGLLQNPLRLGLGFFFDLGFEFKHGSPLTTSYYEESVHRGAI